jgi:hypothetical protein
MAKPFFFFLQIKFNFFFNWAGIPKVLERDMFQGKFYFCNFNKYL